MEKKLILEELFRMRELMGMNVLSETRYSISRNLLMEGGKTVDELIGLGPKSVDNLTKNGVDFVNDLSKLSDEFTARGIKTFDDLVNSVATVKGLDIANVTDDMIEAYIKNDDALYKSILAKASAAAADQVDQLIKNVNLSTIFSKSPDQLKSYNVYISTPPSARNIDVLMDGVNDSIDELDKIIDDLNAAGSTVPDELKELYEQMVSKKTDLTNYKNKGTSSTPSPDPNKPKTDDEIELDRLRKQKELDLQKIKNVDDVKSFIKKEDEWKKLGWWPNWMGNKNKQQVLDYIEGLLGKYDYETMRQMAIKELQRVSTKKEIAKLGKKGTWFERFLANNPKTISVTTKIGLVAGILAAIYYGFAASFIKGAYENNKDVVMGTEIDDCFKTVTGWSDMTDDAKTKFVGLGYGCQNRNNDEAPNDFISSVKYMAADPTKGTAEKFIITIGGNVKEVLASGKTNTTTPAYDNSDEGFKKWVSDKGYTNPSFSGLWYTDNGTDKQAKYEDGTFK